MSVVFDQLLIEYKQNDLNIKLINMIENSVMKQISLK
jgi:hypothetical protein